MVQHVLNRGNGRMRLFRKPRDYEAFVGLLADAGERVPGVELFSYCLMPNHWHLVLRPDEPGKLSAYMSWLTNTHVRRWRQHWHSVGQGHVYQGRYKSFIVQTDSYFLTLARYVEANPLRARLVARAEAWRWSSLSTSATPDGRALLKPWPLDKPRDWVRQVNKAMPDAELDAVRMALKRGRPLGEQAWVEKTAKKLGLDFTLRPRGRPKKTAN